MKFLINKIKIVQQSLVESQIKNRIQEFQSFKDKSNEDWFSELCFCILTANAKAKTSLVLQQTLGYQGFTITSQETLTKIIKDHKHRFHNNKAKYIIQARKFTNIKEIIINKDGKQAREWLVQNIKGLGYKEASHFLRNTGTTSLAILDRHILNLMVDHKIINEKPKTLTKKKYLEIEQKLLPLCTKLNINQSKLDLYLWYLKTNKVLK